VNADFDALALSSLALLARELRVRTGVPEPAVRVAATAVDLVYALREHGKPLFVLVRAFWVCPVREFEPAGASAHVLALTPEALARVPVAAGLVRQLGVGEEGGSAKAAAFVMEASAAGHLMPDPDFVREHGVASVVGFGARLPTGHALAAVAFSRTSADRAWLRSFELCARRTRFALLAAPEIRARMDREAWHDARIAAVEDLSAVQEAHAEQAAVEASAAASRVRREVQRDLEAQKSELLAQNERLRRTQRAVLNVIDDLREARDTLEARVVERTREREELLAKERVMRVEAEAARAQAESANRMKDQFLSTVSHELRTPLNAMLGWAAMLRSGRLDESRRTTALDTIERSARAQVRLIEDLLDLGRILAGKFQLAVGPVEVVRVVEAAIESLRPAAEAKGVRLQATLDSHATIVGDGERLQQIVWNLVSNAIKFTPRGGRVHVTVLRAPSFVEIAVSDTGRGIDARLLPHVFEPFRQAEATISERTGGLGLGLSIVRSLVELHGGTVKAESEGPGKGAVFAVHIPVAPVRATPTEPNPAALEPAPAVTFERAPGLVGARVLVVDDEKDTRQMVAFVLEQSDARVTTAASAEEAVALLERETFDALVSDVGMPGEDGLSMIARVRRLPAERGGHIPAAALTAYARSEDRAQAIRAGFDTHLTKPVEPSELALVVAALLRKRESG
jgi:signal transduction histidine kinase/ActR/RegA family two-component response regulator